jgi:putative acetyltransferase
LPEQTLTLRVDRGDDGDRAAVRRVHEAAFGQPDEADMVDGLRAGEAWLAPYSLLAEVGGEVVGHVLLSRLSVGGAAALALAPLAVLPGHQSTGVGSALVREVLARAADDGEGFVVVLGNPAYYGRFGFTSAAGFGLTGGYSFTGDAWQALVLPGGAALSGEVRYPAPLAP